MIDQHYLQCHFFTPPDKDHDMNDTSKRTFRISEAARILKVQTSVLRYWETVFPEYLHPERTPGGQRAYTQKDMDVLKNIHALLYSQRMTIEGARKVLEQVHMRHSSIKAAGLPILADSNAAGDAAGARDVPYADLLADIMKELKNIQRVLAQRLA